MANLAFRTHAEQRAVGQHDGHAARLGRRRQNHVLDPGVVTALGRRQAGKVAAVGVAAPHVVAPLFQRERRIGDDTVERDQAVARVEGGLAKRIAADHIEILDAVQEQIHAGDGGRGQVLLLAEQLAPERANVAAGLADMVDRLDQHTARSAGRVVDRLALARIEDADHQIHHAARRIELARLLVGGVGEFLDQVFVGLAEYVGAGRPVAQRQLGKVLDQIADPGADGGMARQEWLACRWRALDWEGGPGAWW